MSAHRKGPRLYADAFPAIDIAATERHFKRGEQVCIWVNEHKLPVGAIRVKEITKSTIRLRYAFYGTCNVERQDDDITIELTRSDRGEYHGRPMMICPRCGHDRGKLFYVERLWHCSTCHDLTTAKRRFNNPVKWMREILCLEAEIAMGRPKGQQMKTFQAKTDRLAALEARRMPHWEDKEFFYLAVPRWLPGDEIPHVPISPRQWGYGWTPESGTGFRRLNWRFYNRDRLPTLAEQRRADEQRARKNDPLEPKPKQISNESAPSIPLLIVMKDEDDSGWGF